MTDREKIIKKAERIICSTVDRDMIDSFCEDVIDLLKEHEAIKPYRHYARCGTNHKGMDFWYNCGSCKAEILENDKYCHECGRAVKWDGFDRKTLV